MSLWRERRFEVVKGEQWITGAFDRVVIHRNEDGHALGATVYDFKTDDVTGNAAVRARAAHYAPQMRTYRDVIAGMLHIRPKDISLVLVFTGAGIAQRID